MTLVGIVTAVSPEHDWKAHMMNRLPIDHKTVLHAIQHKFCAAFDSYRGNPTAAECEHRSHVHYRKLMLSPEAVEEGLAPPSYLSLRCKADKLRSMARFRLRNTHIRANTDHHIEGYANVVNLVVLITNIT